MIVDPKDPKHDREHRKKIEKPGRYPLVIRNLVERSTSRKGTPYVAVGIDVFTGPLKGAGWVEKFYITQQAIARVVGVARTLGVMDPFNVMDDRQLKQVLFYKPFAAYVKKKGDYVELEYPDERGLSQQERIDFDEWKKRFFEHLEKKGVDPYSNEPHKVKKAVLEPDGGVSQSRYEDPGDPSAGAVYSDDDNFDDVPF